MDEKSNRNHMTWRAPGVRTAAWGTAFPLRDGRTDGTVMAAGRVRQSLEAASLWQEQDGFPRAIGKSSQVVVGFWRPCRGFLSRNHAWTGGAPREGRFHSTGGLPAAAVLAHRRQAPPSHAGVADGNPNCVPGTGPLAALRGLTKLIARVSPCGGPAGSTGATEWLPGISDHRN